MLILEFLSPKSDFFFFLWEAKSFFSASWEITLFSHVIMAALFIFIYFWLRWVFVAAHRLPLVAAQFPHYSGFSRQGSVILVHWLSCPVACGMFPKQTRDLICVPCIGRWICDHWTTEHTSEFPGVVSFTWGRRGACVFSSLL